MPCASTPAGRACSRFPRSRTSPACAIRWRLSPRRARSAGACCSTSAAFVPTHPLSLCDCPADFVALSFYKMFGYPDRPRRADRAARRARRLRRPGSPAAPWTTCRCSTTVTACAPGHEGFEDGTPDFLSALAAARRLRSCSRASAMPRLAARVARAHRAVPRRAAGAAAPRRPPAIVVYGPPDACEPRRRRRVQRPRRRRRVVPYWEVETAASAHGVAMRGGCFCNPGAAEAAFRFDADRTAACFAQLGRDFTIPGFAHCLGPDRGRRRARVVRYSDVDDRALVSGDGCSFQRSASAG